MTKEDLIIDPPVPCDYKIGDKVIYTNDYGVVWEDLIVIGFSTDPVMFGEYGKFIHTDFTPDSKHKGAAWWMPHDAECLRHR